MNINAYEVFPHITLEFRSKRNKKICVRRTQIVLIGSENDAMLKLEIINK